MSKALAFDLRQFSIFWINTNEDELKQSTKTFAVNIIALVEELPNIRSAKALENQLLRCGTSVGANYRSACRAKSRADFIAKLAAVEEEADEAIYWLELLVAARLVEKRRVESLIQEAHEFVCIVVSSIKTMRLRQETHASLNLKSKIRNLK